MRGFKLDKNGDLSITNGVIDTISGNEIIAQSIRTIIGTNKGEWFLNEDEGIDFRYILGKGITEDMVRSQIEIGVKQVDENLYVDDCTLTINNLNRTATVKFTARNEKEVVVVGEKTFN